MGEYINPTNLTKEEFLSLYGKEITKKNFLTIDYESLENEKRMAVILVDNGVFTSALKMYKQSEFNYIQNLLKTDIEKRPYKLYIVDNQKFKFAE